MSENKYFLYIDILGFDKLANEIALKKGLESRGVREHFVNVIQKQIEMMKEKGRIISKYHETDDWLIVVEGVNNVIENIAELSTNHTGYLEYEKAPLEIAIGLAEFDKWADLKNKTLYIQDTTIEFLKTHIIEYYRKWYKEIHNGKSIESTFVIATESAQREMEPLCKGMFDFVEYKRKRFFVIDLYKLQSKSKVFEFLEKIGYSNNRLYDSIDSLYIKPVEYSEITRTLNEKRIVFITGTQEYGKTYTAVRLMWEYYLNGYEPRWAKGNEEYERVKGRERLEGIRTELKPKCIIYFEDPFGKTRYEKRESLEREIGIILDFVDQVEDAYVIITSREEVFKEFEKEKISYQELENFEKKLNIKKPSYDYGKRKEILIQWANKENCQWLLDKTLLDLVLSSLSDDTQLPTPLSIRDFTISSASIKNAEELLEKLAEKSVETESAFAREIEEMPEDKFVFLAIPFICTIPVDISKRVYKKMINESSLKNAWEFERVLDWFKDDKVQIINAFFKDGIMKTIEFSHPTYSQAFKQLIFGEETNLTENKRNLFARLIMKLAEEKKAASAVAWIIYNNFYAFYPSGRNILLKQLAEMDEAAMGVANTITSYYQELPKYINRLLFKLAEKKECVIEVAYAVEDDFDRLPENFRNKLITELAKKDKANESVAWIIAKNYDKLPKNVACLLFKLLGKKEAIKYVATAIAENLNKYPDNIKDEIIISLVETNKAEWKIPEILLNNINKLPDHVRKILVNRLNTNS